MKIYEKPFMEITKFDSSDSIAAINIISAGNAGTVGTVTNLNKGTFANLGTLHQ